ncbi:FAD-binding oxidoreductase [Comamonas endophytica]|uniref:FAD-binding protein n=1 Tax=Comamonas endophytica TaxID=2949090 RepID=A0ABY6G8M6_9BURK|nr:MULTISPECIES: FAD-binding protein [unclassified Acidovorax]MCD2514262.1 FAD-binding protein [Acidovorax sp. D4N7]UYG51401.1 FAD-binding protein [Acidovorax sp. 5MLIR]
MSLQLYQLFRHRFIPGAAALQHYGADTGGAQRALYGAVRISQPQEVAALIGLARCHGLALWPICGGRNFGYGTALPVRDGALIVDLSGLKGMQFHAESHTVTVEAGVTQGDLQHFLASNRLPYLVPTTGAGPHGSLIGNALDGGYGMTPVPDHFDGLSHFQGYWGNGSPMSDPLAELASPDMARRWPAGIGMNPRSLLRQGNLGIVTAATLQLAPRQPHARLIAIRWDSEQAFEKGMETLAGLQEVIPAMTSVYSVNKERLQATNGQLALRDPSMQCAARHEAQPARQEFISMATIFGPRHATAGACKDIRRQLEGARLLCLSRGQLALLGRLCGMLPAGLLSRSERLARLHRNARSLASALALLDGTPSHEFLKLAYAARQPAPQVHAGSDPAKDGQGILWFAPLIPLTPSGVRGGMALIRGILVRHGFDALLALTIRNPRAGIATIPLIFPKTQENARRAHACYQELVTACTQAGMPPYRLNIESMATLAGLRVAGEHPRLHACLKAALDPDDIIAPGRYG